MACAAAISRAYERAKGRITVLELPHSVRKTLLRLKDRSERPPANQIVHVVLKKPLKGLRMMDPYWIDGTLDLARGDTGMGVYGYRLKAEALQPYVEKKK